MEDLRYVDSHSARAYYTGDYEIKTPALFFVNQATNLQFSIDAHGSLSFSSSSMRNALEEYEVQTQVLYELIHPNDNNARVPGSSLELGPMLRIRLTWIKDGSPELYEFSLLRNGGGYEYDTESERRLKSDRSVVLLYAFVTSNDGDPFSAPDREASLVSFRPK